MEIVREFEGKYGGVWTKVRFYKEEPEIKRLKRGKGIRFCEAVGRARLSPLILDKESISCPGARYVFGWDNNLKEKMIKACGERRSISKEKAESILDKIPLLPQGFKYIGLNLGGEPDLVISYPQPEQFMNLLKAYQNHQGENLDISLSSVVSVCGNIAVRTFLGQEINISFGCDDSREYGNIGRDRLVVGIPKRLFDIFIR